MENLDKMALRVEDFFETCSLSELEMFRDQLKLSKVFRKSELLRSVEAWVESRKASLEMEACAI